MKKVILSLALIIMASSAFAQTDKAAAKAAAKAKKEATKAAKTQMEEAQKILEAIDLKIKDKEKPATEQEIFAECGKGKELIGKAIASGLIEEKKLGEAYKCQYDLAVRPHNLYLGSASRKEPLDTLAYYDNLKLLTDAMANELKFTEKKTGDSGNEKYLKDQQQKLASSAIYYIYAAQFEGECKRFDRAIEAYDISINYGKRYPLVADQVKLPIEVGQIAYYAFQTAYQAKDFKAMDKYYEQALTFEEGALGVKQIRMMSYLEAGDTVTWAKTVREICLKDPAANEDNIQRLSAYYQTKSTDEMIAFADEIIAINPDIYIAHYARAYAFFANQKYDEALMAYKKCTEIKPEQYDAWYQCGLCKYRQALDLNSTISTIKNQVEAKKQLEKTKGLFGEAIPFFEKAREVTPDDPQKWAYELKQCYTVVGKAAEAAAMDKLL